MTTKVALRDVRESDLATFYAQQIDPEATSMAAFPSRDWDAFMAHWAKILADTSVTNQTVLFDGDIAGNIGCWGDADERKVSYWLGREYWGKGIASAALSQFVTRVSHRPLFARVARHNVASIRVLEKCGFAIVGEDQFVLDDGTRDSEFILTLNWGSSGRGISESPTPSHPRR